MTSVIETKFPPHIDYCAWITQFSFLLTRKNTKQEILELGGILDKILSSLYESTIIWSNQYPNYYEKQHFYLTLLYKLIAYTRDIYVGKGERDLSYLMIFTWHCYFPSYAIRALELFTDSKYSIGSWKDIKYFCKWVRDYSSLGIDDPLITICIEKMNRQFNLDRNRVNISMVAKWIPRESSQFEWLYNLMVTHWVSTLSKKEKKKLYTMNHVKQKYRKEMSSLNRILDTPQIKQCEQNWASIDPKKVSMITKNKQFCAFLNMTHIRNKSDMDRIKCKEHFEFYYRNERSVNTNPLFLNISMGQWMRDMISLQYNSFDEKKQKIISDWENIQRDIPKMGNIIPILDLSIPNMDDIIGIVFMIMEKSYLQNRMVLYDLFPRWFSLDEIPSLNHSLTIIERIHLFRNYIKDKGIGSNIYYMIDLIIQTFITTKLSPELIEDMVFVVFTDYSSFSLNELHSEIMNRFQQSGILSPPHFIYWNTSSASFISDNPIDSYANSTLLSGDSSSLLLLLGQLFCSEIDGREQSSDPNIHPIQKISSFELLCNILNHPRYDSFGTIADFRSSSLPP